MHNTKWNNAQCADGDQVEYNAKQIVRMQCKKVRQCTRGLQTPFEMHSQCTASLGRVALPKCTVSNPNDARSPPELFTLTLNQ